MTEFSTGLTCDYFPLCSGCEDQQNVYTPPIWVELKSFFNALDSSLEVSLVAGEIVGWRTRSKLAVRGSYLQPAVGLFKRNTHEVIPIPTCPLHHPSINKAYAQILRQITSSKIAPYDEQTGQGLLRYLQFSVELKTRNVQLVVVVNRLGTDGEIEKFVKQLYNEKGFCSIWLNFQPHSTNLIFGEKWKHCLGEPYIWQRIGEVEFALHPACFIQAHLSLFEKLLLEVREKILPDQVVLDLYAGVGVIGLNVAAKSRRVICVENNPFAEECFHLSRLKLPFNVQKKVSFQQLAVENCSTLIGEAGVMIIDPPRKGLEPSTLDQIIATPSLKQLIYVSCGPLSFQRDCKKLLKNGWKIESAKGYLLFPGSNHVEILCVFKRSG